MRVARKEVRPEVSGTSTTRSKGGEMTSTTEHISVMRDRCVDLLSPAIAASSNPVVVDATLGLGGHTEALLQKFPQLTVIGIDRDLDAIAKATERLAPFADRLKTAHSTFDGIADVVASFGYKNIDGALFDLGVSSLQLDRAERGFAYSQDAPLDMRMNQSEGITAADVIATYSEQELRTIFHKYGDEKLSARYAKAIVTQRELEPITRSGQLVHILTVATPAALSHSGHPAKRVFQALRIEVNAELEVLKRTMPAAVRALRVGGRIVALAYHSLEDRIVKQALASAATCSGNGRGTSRGSQGSSPGRFNPRTRRDRRGNHHCQGWSLKLQVGAWLQPHHLRFDQ